MYFDQRARSGGGSRARNVANRMRFPALALSILLLPVVLMAYSSNPPLGLSGAPGEGTCAGCHSPLTTGSGVSVTFPGALTYTPGGPPVSLIVALTSGANSGFELSSRVMNDNSQAGSLTAGTASGVGTSGSIQYAYQSLPRGVLDSRLDSAGHRRRQRRSVRGWSFFERQYIRKQLYSDSRVQRTQRNPRAQLVHAVVQLQRNRTGGPDGAGDQQRRVDPHYGQRHHLVGRETGSAPLPPAATRRKVSASRRTRPDWRPAPIRARSPSLPRERQTVPRPLA